MWPADPAEYTAAVQQRLAQMQAMSRPDLGRGDVSYDGPTPEPEYLSGREADHVADLTGGRI